MSRSIAVNARALYNPPNGVRRYTREVTRRLGERVRLVSSETAAQGFQGHFWEQVILPRKIDSAQLLWSPANSGPLAITRQVVTIHDLSPLDQPDGFKYQFRIWYRVLLPLLAKRVRKVITDSDFSRQRIIERLGIAGEKIVTIPCGVDRNHFYPRAAVEIAAVTERYGLPGTYLLTVGSLERRKNLARLLRAWERAIPIIGVTALVVVGSSGRPFRSLRFDHIPEGVLFVPHVREPDLPSLYSGALALVIPSLYEGFGLPALEAMACGSPIIASNAGALPEVVGDAGQFVNPYNVDDITQAIVQMISEPALRGDFASKGQSRAEAFSWDRTAARIGAVLEQARSGP